MIWPQAAFIHLIRIVRIADGGEGREGLFALVVRCETDVVLRVVVFGCDFEYERQLEEVINNRYNFPPSSNC